MANNQFQSARPIQQITNELHKLDVGLRQSVLEEVMKMFIENKKKIPMRLLKDLKKAKKDNKKGEGYDIHMDCKNSRKGVKMYYKQYKHLQKYYPTDLDDVIHFGSIQRGPRAVDIEKKYEQLIRGKLESHLWSYNDETDELNWVNENIFSVIRGVFRKNKVNHTKKVDVIIGGVTWYGLGVDDSDDENAKINYGISSLSKTIIHGYKFLFDNEKSRDDYYDYMMK